MLTHKNKWQCKIPVETESSGNNKHGSKGTGRKV